MKLAEILAAKPEDRKALFDAAVKVEQANTKIRRFTEREAKVIAHRYSTGETAEFLVTAASAKNLKKDLIKQGYYRVDIIEINTIVNERIGNFDVQSRKMNFGPQTFEPADNKFVPDPIETEEPEFAQRSLWLEEDPKPFIYDRKRLKVAEVNAKNKVEKKRREIFRKLNPTIAKDGWKVFDKATGNFLFSSTVEMEIADYMKENDLHIEDVILYVPQAVYDLLKERVG